MKANGNPRSTHRQAYGIAGRHEQLRRGQLDHKRKRAKPKEQSGRKSLSPAYVFVAAPSCSSYINGIVLPVAGSL
ncbi:MAG TPA: hypothetical protein VFG64_00050 [Dongiaceae bacterium]|jgi:hypothetical protein|nr:hypothetical protein [Dongiaceae bacterium]